MDLETRTFSEEWYQIMLLFFRLHSPSDELRNILKLHMFEKSNVKGFQLVMHYLIKVVEQDSVNKVIPWPLHDKKVEQKFRKDVLNYLNGLNEIYEYANIPLVTPSHLITPGGRKFINLLFMFTDFVMRFENIRIAEQNGTLHELEPILIPPKLSDDERENEIMLQNLKKLDQILDERLRKKKKILAQLLESGRQKTLKKEEEVIASMEEKKTLSDQIKQRKMEISDNNKAKTDGHDEEKTIPTEPIMNMAEEIDNTIDLTAQFVNKLSNSSVQSKIIIHETGSLKSPEKLPFKMLEKDENGVETLDILNFMKNVQLMVHEMTTLKRPYSFESCNQILTRVIQEMEQITSDKPKFDPYMIKLIDSYHETIRKLPKAEPLPQSILPKEIFEDGPMLKFKFANDPPKIEVPDRKTDSAFRSSRMSFFNGDSTLKKKSFSLRSLLKTASASTLNSSSITSKELSSKMSRKSLKFSPHCYNLPAAKIGEQSAFKTPAFSMKTTSNLNLSIIAEDHVRAPITQGTPGIIGSQHVRDAPINKSRMRRSISLSDLDKFDNLNCENISQEEIDMEEYTSD